MAADHKLIAAVQAYSKLNTNTLFRGSAPSNEMSPLDQFIKNTDSINVIAASASTAAAEAASEAAAAGANPLVTAAAAPAFNVSPELGALILLGYMSAVESYLRAIVRGLIGIDDQVRSLVEPMNVSYAAAVHHSRHLLPEALTEGMSFAGGDNVKELLRKIVGIKKNFPPTFDPILIEFSKICEIRHCCVHRFGRLGSKTALALGLEEHKASLEVPFTPTFQELQVIADLLRTFVKTVNNLIFETVITRVNSTDRDAFLYPWKWTWNARTDQAQFKKYYALFATRYDTTPSPSQPDLYKAFRVAMQPSPRAANARRARAAVAAATA